MHNNSIVYSSSVNRKELPEMVVKIQMRNKELNFLSF